MNLKAIFAGDGPQSLYALDLPPALNLTVVAPHPDDFDAIGVTLRFFHEQGHRINTAIALTGSGVEAAYDPGADLAERMAIRTREQQQSLHFFGLRPAAVEFLDLERDASDQLIRSAGNQALIEALLNGRKVDLLFLPHGQDTNSAHRNLYRLVKQALAARDADIALLLNRDPKTIAMRTDLYMPFGQTEAQWKAQLLRFHDSQQQRNLHTRAHGFDERILETNRTVAGELGLDDEFAEAFEVEIFPPANP